MNLYHTNNYIDLVYGKNYKNNLHLYFEDIE